MRARYLSCCLCLALSLAAMLPPPGIAADATVHTVGIGRADITPKYPVRLSGFAFRRAESEGVGQRIWARALAFGKDDPAVLIAVDNLGVSAALVAELAKRLEGKGVKRDRLSVTATHTHTAPMLRGVCATIFGVPIPKEHQEHIDRYTRDFLDGMEKAALAALADRKPARLSWGIGKVTFAINRRRRPIAPVDHDLPLLAVRDLTGKLRAVWVNYACHCVTLSNNKISGDWAGHAVQAIEDDHKGALALVSIGCGADSNPSSGVTGDKVEIASRQGMEIGKEVNRLLKGYLAPVTGPLTSRAQTIALPLADLPTREQWEMRARGKDAVAHHARVNLERLARGEKLPTAIDYRIVTWAFGSSLGIVFLPGEVVADYAVRLKKELDGRRLWIHAYSNDSPGYVPSERVLKEGGYEGGGAMIYYDIPAPYRPGLEEKIVRSVITLLGKEFASPFDSRRTGGSLPLSPQQSRSAIQVKKGLQVDLMAAEPLVTSPVAIDFGPDGRLWVAEMFDYPSGVQGDFQPGGRIRVLEDTDGDGRYDRSTIFLDKIPFPTGVTVWRNGVLICAAPDILYAEDTRGTGKADRVVKLYSGFGTHNYQARINSLHDGLDGWVYGSCGLFGGKITCHRTGKVVNLGDRDFRIRPDTGEIEPAVGRTQQGRVRDDAGNWFACDNSTLARHLVLADHYLHRNPHVAFTGTTSYVPDYPDSTRLYPVGGLQLFTLSGPAGRPTGACGIGVYRDDLLGAEYRGNLFTCEPVNLLVHRLRLTPRGSTFSGRRADDEKDREFLASSDGWFRPVQIRTGPDGALWVVDMYRHVIEHPRWIPTADLERLDVRAGAGMGRIYRIRRADVALRTVPRLDRMTTRELVAALNTPNGTVRDLASQMLLWGNRVEAAPDLEKLAQEGRAEARLHALCLLDVLGKLKPALVEKALRDADAAVRRHAVRLAEPFLGRHPEIGKALVKRVHDGDAQVRLQVAFSLGQWRDPAAGKALAGLVSKHARDPHLVSAVLSSLHAGNAAAVLADVLATETPPPALVQRLLAVAAAVGEKTTLAKLFPQVMALKTGRFQALAAMLDALERRRRDKADLGDDLLPKRFARLFAQARAVAVDEKAAERERLGALALLGRQPDDAETLTSLLNPRSSPAVQSAALTALARLSDARVADTLLAGWKSYTPAVRGQALDLLFARPVWTARLLTALEKKEMAPGQIDATRRQLLLQHRDAKVRRRAAALMTGSSGASRDKVIAEFEAALSLRGDSTRGKAVFARHCSACHQLEGVGHAVGPELHALVNKTPRYLMHEILDPNRNLDSRYQVYLATTMRGQTFTGMLSGESATSITLRGQEGKTQVLLRADIEELSGTGKSLMPEGLEKDLSKQDLADLLSYLSRQTSPAKRFAGNHPEIIRKSGGGYALLATTGEIHGGDICFEETFRNIGHWHGEADHVVWTVQVEKTVTLDVWLDYSCADAVAGNAFVFDGGKEPMHGKADATGGWDRYRQKKLGQIVLLAGQQRLTFRPNGRPRGALLDLRGIHLVPPGAQPFAALLDTAKPADAQALAKQLLDDKLPQARRQAIIAEHPTLAAELIAAMTADLGPGKEEYRRIPWIWRVAVAAGRRNDTATLKKVLDVSLPAPGMPLRDWQAVVIGGGVINGVSDAGAWPGERMAELVKDSAERKKRWLRALEQSAAMADDAKVPTGTRYDALRMIALDSWEKRGAQLVGYLKKGTHQELTMGAISGLSDIDSPRVPPLLIAGLEHFSPGNRKLAIAALLRTDARALALLDAVAAGKVKPDWLSREHHKALREHKNDKVRARAKAVLEK